MGHIFISYSRNDQDFSQRLNNALLEKGKETWVDYEGIPPTAKWMEEIELAIEKADAFLFILSPESVKSVVCKYELDAAIQFSKRLIPIIHKKVSENEVPESLANIQWLSFENDNNFDLGVESLIKSIDVDLEWVHLHTELLRRSRTWKKKERRNSELLKSRSLRDWEDWLSGAGLKEPRPSQLQIEFIGASRKSATRRLWYLLGTAMAAIIILLFLLIWVGLERIRADEKSKIAVARQLAAQSGIVSTERESLLELSALLAVESMKRLPSLENDIPLRQALHILPQPKWTSGDSIPLTALVFSSVTNTVMEARNNRITLRELKSGKEIESVEFENRIRALLVSEVDEGFAILFANGQLRIFQNSSDIRNAILVRSSDPINSVTIEPKGTILVAGTTNGKVLFVNRKNGKIFRTWRSSVPTRIESLKFSSDSKFLAISSDRSVLLWDMIKSEEVEKINHTQGIYDIAFQPGTYKIAVASDIHVYIWEVPGKRLLKSLKHIASPRYIVFDKDGNNLITTAHWDAIIWNTQNWSPLGKLNHQGPVNRAYFSPDESKILTASNDDTARLWDRSNRKEILRFCHRGFVNHISFSRDGQNIVTGGRDKWLKVWEASNPNNIVKLDNHPSQRSPIFTRDGLFMATPYNENSWVIKESITGRHVLRINQKEDIKRLAVSGDESLIAVSFFFKGQYTVVRILHTLDSTKVKNLHHFKTVSTMAFSPDHQYFASGCHDQKVRIWNTLDWTLEAECSHDSYITSVCFSPKERKIAASSGARRVKIWTWDQNSIHTELELRGVHNVESFDPEGKFLLTRGDDDARLYDLSNGNIKFFDHQFPVLDAAFSSNGKLIATAASDLTVRIWDPEAHNYEVARIHSDELVNRVQFTSDSKRLVALTNEFAYFYIVEREELMETTCQRLTKNLTGLEWLIYIGSEDLASTCPNLPEPWTPSSRLPEP